MSHKSNFNMEQYMNLDLTRTSLNRVYFRCNGRAWNLRPKSCN